VRRLLRLLLLSGLIPVVAAACGGGGDSSSEEAPRLTQQQFVTQANRVCIKSDRRIFDIGQLTTDPNGWQKTAAAAKVGVNEMAVLRPPEAKQKQFDAMLAQGRRLQDAVADVYAAIVANDLTKARDAQRRAAIADSRIKRQASALGLTFCEQLLTNWPA
jgi:hypothetical protein